MTAPAWPVVRRCTCGRLRQEHYFTEADKRHHLRPLGTDDGRCAGYVEAAVEERPPASVLRARLAAVAAIPARPTVPGDMGPVEGLAYAQGWMDARAAAVAAARGETP